MTEDELRERFRKSPIKRAKRRGLFASAQAMQEAITGMRDRPRIGSALSGVA